MNHLEAINYLNELREKHVTSNNANFVKFIINYVIDFIKEVMNEKPI